MDSRSSDADASIRANGNLASLVAAPEMPDVAGRRLHGPEGTLDWVGMGDIRQPLRVRDGTDVREVQSRVQVYVNLGDGQAKGIHMSRLYLILDEHADTRPLSCAGLKLLLGSFLESHRDLSGQAYVQFDFDYYLRRRALVSEHSGWNSYPVSISGRLAGGEVQLELCLGVWYSSTCPASAALARQLIQHQFEQDFGTEGLVPAHRVRDWLGAEESIAGTPHSQRSIARIRVQLDDRLESFPITHLVDVVEDALSTPVQTAVKREDEQEFARRNAANLMFCEDAGRRLKSRLNDEASLLDYWVRVEHHESLHAHDAVSIFAKGVPGGYEPRP